MKKIVKSLLFVAIVASMSMVGSCGGLLESSGDDVGDTSSTNHPLVGKHIKAVYMTSGSNIRILLLDRTNQPSDDSLMFYNTNNANVYYECDSVIITEYTSPDTLSIEGYRYFEPRHLKYWVEDYDYVKIFY